MDRREFLRLAGAGSAALAALGVAACPDGKLPVTREKPNILYLMCDQLRADCVGCFGNPVIRTPNLDKIAAGGVRFTRAYTSTPSCTPARSGLLTGLSPWNHGMLGYGRVARYYPHELPAEISRAGYYTFGIGKMHWFPQKSLHGFHATLVDESGRVESPGFVSDYRKWFKEQAPDLDPDTTGLGWNDYRSKPYALPEELHPTCWTGGTAVEFIENYKGNEPFMLKVSFARPHSPYDPPARFWEAYDESTMPAPVVGAWAERYEPVTEEFGNDIWHGKLDPATVRRSRRGYYGSVSFIDQQIGMILAALERRKILDNTLIVFFTDHGDMLGDHNLWRKTYAYEGSARVPLILRWPRTWGMDDRRGGERAEPVELRDILPTLLDAAGAPGIAGLDGRSLLELVRGENRSWREVLDLEHDRCYGDTNHWNALTDGHWKYVYCAYDGSEQLFDLSNDPHELEDLAGVPGCSAKVLEWRARLTEHLSVRGDFFVKGDKLQIRGKRRMHYSPNYPGPGAGQIQGEYGEV
ncbi:MAG TPA: arylsulfatase [archaeon]|nr:arylsulfatase [archaeon]